MPAFGLKAVLITRLFKLKWPLAQNVPILVILPQLHSGVDIQRQILMLSVVATLLTLLFPASIPVQVVVMWWKILTLVLLFMMVIVVPASLVQ